MNTTFKRIAKTCGFPIVHLNAGDPAWTTSADKREFMLAEMQRIDSENHARGVFLNYHSTTPDLSEIKRARGLHMVRDPRDMLISAIRYHATSDEAWLDEPSGAYGGMSFRMKLESLDDLRDKVQFELDTHMGEEIERMAMFSTRPDFAARFVEVRYEDLIVDSRLVLFEKICAHLGIDGVDLESAKREFWASSIFGGMRSDFEQGTHPHINVAESNQWRDGLDERVLRLIHERIGGLIDRLGYEMA